ncbi:MAG: copper chaperone PCu(A)C [Phenylobacterium sp.]|nr:MAG: copper chaperone PCu(A)C [Phenylobacterium sp.]
MPRPALLPIILALSAASAQASASRSGALEAADAWSRPAAAGLNGVGYMTLANHGPRAEALVKVESPLAQAVEIHRTTMSAGVMSMAAQPRVEIPAGGHVAFAPGAYHLMFVRLKATLKAGDKLPATLVFADGRRIGVAFAVGSGAPPVGHSDAAVTGVAERSQFVTKK